MTSPLIEAREAGKILDLLRFALEQEGVSADQYALGETPAQLGPVDDRFCLVGGATWFGLNKWRVFYSERGERRHLATFATAREGARYLFWKLTGAKDMYDHREAWEAATGKSFSAV
jgi:hypothetical protein